MKVHRIILFLCFSTILLNRPAISQIENGQVGLSLRGGMVKLVGGSSDGSVVNYMSGLALRYSFSERLSGSLEANLGWVRPRDPDSYFKTLANAPYRTYLFPVHLMLQVYPLTDRKFSPFLGFGLGLIRWNLRDVSGDDTWFPVPESGTSLSGVQINATVLASLGGVLFLTDQIALEMEMLYGHLLDQDLDNIGTGDANSGMLNLRLGLTFYFNANKDTDGDGILDKNDGDPKHPEDIDGFQDDDGIPDLDNDSDGIPDQLDMAPNLPEDMDGFQDEDGAPDLDNDQDGIPDSLDLAPNEAEDIDGFQDEDGAPDLDNDGDGIPDIKDKAPNQPETFNGYQDDDGVPDEKPVAPILEEGQSIVLEGVTFQLGKYELTENAKTILRNVGESLKANPDVYLEIRGFTDNTGSAETNLRISQRRADAVRDFLIDIGIEAVRLKSVGYGEADPIASNSTKEGRAKNRRIEFIRLER